MRVDGVNRSRTVVRDEGRFIDQHHLLYVLLKRLCAPRVLLSTLAREQPEQQERVRLVLLCCCVFWRIFEFIYLKMI